jgi:hypothetical protein
MAALTVAVDRADVAGDAVPGGPAPVRSAGPAAADRSGAGARADRAVWSWPLLVLAARAAAELWSGWAQVDQARDVARRLAVSGKPVSRRAMRSGGVRGSNEALNSLARILNGEMAGKEDRRDPEHPHWTGR